MKLSKYRKIGFYFLLINYILVSDLFFQRKIFASPENVSNKPTVDYIKKIPSNNFYILGPGDLLELKVSEDDSTSILDKTFMIDGEGVAVLKRLNKIYASGLTISELTEILNKEYSKYVKTPNVELNIIKYRPVKFYIDGEVDNPGFHVLPGAYNALDDIDALTINSKGVSDLNTNSNFPTVIDIIRKAGGITVNADLENITITRKNSISNGSGRRKSSINLLKTLDLEDISQNIRILDGDTILIPRSSTPLIAQISKAIKSNMNPKFIDVYVGGRVESTGTVRVSKSAVLSEALVISGGVKALRGPVTFLRYNSDGSIDQRSFRYKKSSERGSYTNPFLRSGDVIYVGKSPLNVASEVLSEITSPIQSLVTTYSLYKIINDSD